MDELEERLRRRDTRFLWRIGAIVGVAALLGIFVWVWIVRADVGGCVARGFGNVTDGAGR